MNCQNLSSRSDTTICEFEALSLTSTNLNGTFKWDDGTILKTRTFGAQGTYWLEITEGECAFRDSINISIQALPEVEIENEIVFCHQEPITISAYVENASYLWEDGTTAAEHLIDTEGEHKVIITLQNCSIEETVFVTDDCKTIVEMPNVITYKR